MRLVLCHGCWDGIHAGHLRHLEAAKAAGDRLIVSVSTDAAIRKGPGRPYMPERQRLQLVQALRCVDEAMLNADPSASGLIRFIRPAVFAKGHDYFARDEPWHIDELLAIQAVGGTMLYTPGDVVYSSTVVFAQSS